MSNLTTCWDLLRGAAEGHLSESEEFCTAYRPLIVDFLSRRWRGWAAAQETEDAAQEVMLECLREDGALDRAIRTARGGFRSFLFGVTMNVARRFESRWARVEPTLGAASPPSSIAPVCDSTPDQDFERAWASSVVRRARESFEMRAKSTGGASQQRCEILRLRFFEDLPIRSIAKLLGEDAKRIHHEYARARKEFRESLEEVMRFEDPDGGDGMELELSRLISNLD